MNYLHGFHAGNHADVLKHCVLLYLINRLKTKDKAFFVLDTHAGRGQYLIQGEQANKTGEALQGIFKLITYKKLPEPMHFYLKQVERVNPVGSLINYPGSPVLIAQQLREQDRLICYESQKPEFDALRQIFKNDHHVKTVLGDGYQALKALLPPSERRGLVLIDPPYEAQEQEFQQILNSLHEALLRWPTGQFAIWYPIKQRRSLIGFFRKVAQLPMKSALVFELLVRKDNSPLRMNGSGMLIINPPYQMDTDLNASMSKLVDLLSDGEASHRIAWIKTES
ncbi:MAG: 23S rRNA (adenine(2030)-N(6))-methyltransferase RlmJ [Arenimonas sp.]|nr:23S rRNA (adenine(2030)-N(6))-methyltransferase RlmJ [Arenimonas sp.]